MWQGGHFIICFVLFWLCLCVVLFFGLVGGGGGGAPHTMLSYGAQHYHNKNNSWVHTCVRHLDKARALNIAWPKCSPKHVPKSSPDLNVAPNMYLNVART